MLKAFSLACLGLLLLLSGFLGCSANVAPTDTGGHGSTLGEQNIEGQSFEVQFPFDVTTESVIAAIVAAGHDELAAACESTPIAAIRILNPLASGEYSDVPCAAILGEEEMVETSAALTSHADGPIGQTQQKIGPISLLACAIGSAGTGMFTRYALCPHGRTERDRTKCNDVGLWGSAGITFICTLPFLPIFF